MAAVPMKAEYGPTLGQLLAPRWRAMSRRTRWALAAVPALIVLLAIAVALTLENASFSGGGRVPFSFSYRGLYRVAPQEGEYVRLERRAANGLTDDSFAVRPLRLPAYSGLLSGELPLYASGYIRSLRARYADFELRGEGKSNLDVEGAYDIYFTTRVDGRDEFGRVVLYMPGHERVREGVAIVMLTTQVPRYPLTAPPEVAATGILERPLRSFSFG